MIGDMTLVVILVSLDQGEGERLVQFVSKFADDDSRIAIQDALRRLVHRHRQFIGSWANAGGVTKIQVVLLDDVDVRLGEVPLARTTSASEPGHRLAQIVGPGVERPDDVLVDLPVHSVASGLA